MDNMELLHGILLIVCFVSCQCKSKENTFTKDPAFANVMCPEDQVEFQRITRSAIACVSTCDKTPGCTSLIYLHDNKTCFGIKSADPFSASTPLPGAVFYKPSSSAISTTESSTVQSTAEPKTQTASTYGPGSPMVVGLLDSQFTASTWSSLWEPWQARLDTPVYTWSPSIDNTAQWLQVDFSRQVIATHVTTKGCIKCNVWVKSYRVLTSVDCSSFVAVTDDFGNDKVFPGNADPNTAVDHALEPPVACRCLRINPLTWHGHIDLRLEVLGHLI